MIPYVNIALYACFVPIAYADKSVSQYFGITVNGSVNLFTHRNVLLRCAFDCLTTPDCCAGYYDTTNGTCTLKSCCDVQTEKYVPQQIVSITMASKFGDCSDYACGGHVSGAYEIFYDGHRSVNVYCYLNESRPWTVIQQRLYGDVDFERNWEEYKKGFGFPTTDFWIGNDILHILTNKRSYTLRFDMEDFAGEKAFAEYNTFVVDDEAKKYKLTVGGYSGDAGDSFKASNNNMFSTFDSDNDAINIHCAISWKCGWWFYRCGQCNPNGPFSIVWLNNSYSNMRWNTWRGLTQLKTIQMKISPNL